MKTLQLLCPEHSEGAAHLGEKSCSLDIGQMRGQVCLGILCSAEHSSRSIILDCQSAPLKWCEVCEFTVVSAVPRTVPGIY